ncbi:hypothetical protein [Parasitella parasitica]|uniref:Uncharacterized protein n=1 Tax=Parasitella parasitica TaxID=35722 RepID=A0A0B7MQM2_9FUNG|nr:hypothetical protein [Parasitella parasitica]
MEKKRAHHISAPIVPNYRVGHSTSDSLFDECPPPAYQPPQSAAATIAEPPQSLQSKSIQNLNNFNQLGRFYQPTPSPQTVIVHRQPTRSKDACCWGW